MNDVNDVNDVNEICVMLDILLKSIKPCLNNEKITILDNIKPSSAEFVIKSVINSLYGISVEKQTKNDPDNYCGNCKHCIKSQNGNYYKCEVITCKGADYRIDPDDNACPNYESAMIHCEDCVFFTRSADMNKFFCKFACDTYRSRIFIDGKDPICEYFKLRDTSFKSKPLPEKPNMECCEHCKGLDCSECAICPF